MGSVSAIRGNLEQAEKYVRKALDIAPTYAAAKHDLRLIKYRRAAHPTR
jgi:hypothetical protein